MNPLIPRPTPVTQRFWDGLAEGRIVVPRCERCSGWVFYPRRHCPHCGSLELAWREVSGRATLCSYTFARVPTLPEFAGLEPQNLAIVTFEEGFNTNTVLTGVALEDFRIGMPLRPVFDRLGVNAATRLLFTSAG